MEKQIEISSLSKEIYGITRTWVMSCREPNNNGRIYIPDPLLILERLLITPLNLREIIIPLFTESNLLPSVYRRSRAIFFETEGLDPDDIPLGQFYIGDKVIPDSGGTHGHIQEITPGAPPQVIWISIEYDEWNTIGGRVSITSQERLNGEDALRNMRDYRTLEKDATPYRIK